MVSSTEGDDDHRDLEPLERDAPERKEEARPVEAVSDVLLDLLLADADSPAVSGDDPDPFAQPLQDEREQERADDDPDRRQRYLLQRRPQSADQDGQDDKSSQCPCQRPAPLPGRTDGDDNRNHLDHFDGRCEERRDEYGRVHDCSPPCGCVLMSSSTVISFPFSHRVRGSRPLV